VPVSAQRADGFDWSWVDPAIALLVAAWAVRESAEAWQGEDCC
jgi:Co/Zn/Cd efflux system component